MCDNRVLFLKWTGRKKVSQFALRFIPVVRCKTTFNLKLRRLKLKTKNCFSFFSFKTNHRRRKLLKRNTQISKVLYKFQLISNQIIRHEDTVTDFLQLITTAFINYGRKVFQIQQHETA